MPLPSSGALGLSNIWTEMNNGGLIGPTYPYSLGGLSATAGFDTTSPFPISQFYGYSASTINWNFMIFNNTGFCTGQMDIYVDSTLEVSTTTGGDSGAIYPPAGALIEIYVSTGTFVFGIANAEIYFGPILFVANSAPGYVTSYYSFTHSGGTAGVTGLSYDY